MWQERPRLTAHGHQETRRPGDQATRPGGDSREIAIQLLSLAVTRLHCTQQITAPHLLPALCVCRGLTGDLLQRPHLLPYLRSSPRRIARLRHKLHFYTSRLDPTRKVPAKIRPLPCRRSPQSPQSRHHHLLDKHSLVLAFSALLLGPANTF